MLKVARVIALAVICTASLLVAHAQRRELIRLVKESKTNKINIFVGEKLFTSFLYPDTLEKPVLYPVNASNGVAVTRGFPLNTKPGDPIDHPHHIGIWFNFENVNGLDFWNNSYAIPPERKPKYGWVKTDKILETTGGQTGVLAYHANWTDHKNKVLLEETTRYEFSASGSQRIIDRFTTLTASTEVVFTDVKDGLFAIRVAHELQIPTDEDQKFTDDKGNVTVVKGGTDKVANGNMLSSAGKAGNEVWGTRAAWVKMFGKMSADSVTVAIIDHPKNVNYPTYWHARGYGLFAANPLGEKVFTNDQKSTNLKLNKGESVTFKHRLVVDNGSKSISPETLNKLASSFGKM
ncbi:hypothetical protein EXU57_13150 [Segetibacter sp. 3557_3]|uniref:DUF6807 domain-containing protein n=1 Tax=Segetibacter sp. 3557_3 TaxID=2547429 RepID=UPI001058F1A8|nr:PmoA family protein [Segetibacter sp. 3557_3]TDH25643.1 hypothetical protein EXU57_13150 [Segetibacter sp. 3557_3]